VSLDDDLQRTFDTASSAMDLDGGSLDRVRLRAAQRNRSARLLQGAAALVLVGALVTAAYLVGRASGPPPGEEVAIIAGSPGSDTELPTPLPTPPPTPQPDDETAAPAVDTDIDVSEQLTEADFTYLGAFRAPADEIDETSYAYGGEASAFNPYGDPDSTDGFDGSLFLTSHIRRNQSVGELTIPAPQFHNGTPERLPIAELIGSFGDITGGRGLPYVGSTDVGGQDEYRYGGLEVVDGPDGPRLHWSIWQYQNIGGNDVPAYGHSSLDLSAPDPQGPWHLGEIDSRQIGGYLFAVPPAFADEALDGRSLVTGFRSGAATSGRSWGPPFFAYAPPEQAEPAIRLEHTEVAVYPDRDRDLPGFNQADTASGAAWITTSQGVDAVVTVGYRGLGEVLQGAPREDDCGINTGVHAGPYEPLVMFYDPADLASAAAGEIPPWELTPYRTWNPAEHLIPTCQWDLSSISFDPDSGRVYIVQMEAATDQNEYSPVPVIHVFQI